MKFAGFSLHKIRVRTQSLAFLRMLWLAEELSYDRLTANSGSIINIGYDIDKAAPSNNLQLDRKDAAISHTKYREHTITWIILKFTK